MQSIDGAEIVSVSIKSRPGQSFIIDKDDVDVVGEWSWSLNSKGYVGRKCNKTTLRLHRAIFEKHYGTIPEDKEIDHVDQDKLNNRKSNLRLCSHAENQRNRKVYKNNKLGVKGVCIHQGKYQANIRFNSKLIYLGYFNTLAEAAIVYNIGSILFHQGYANLNQYRVNILISEEKKRFDELEEMVRQRLEKSDIVFVRLTPEEILDRLSSSDDSLSE